MDRIRSRTLASATLLGGAIALLMLLPARGQSSVDACDAAIDNLRTAIVECGVINTGWACYGSVEAEALPIKYRFHRPSDQRPLEILESINTVNEQGVVVMTLAPEGELDPVTAILFGQATLDATGGSAYILDTSGGDLCTQTPPGMIVRTESGRRGAIVLNGATIELGSTALVTMASTTMTVVNLDGNVSVVVTGDRADLPVGHAVEVDGEGRLGSPQPTDLIQSPVYAFLANDPAGLPAVRNLNATALRCTGIIDFGQTLSDQLYSPGQECLYSFCAEAGDIVTIRVDAQTPDLDPWVDLRAPGMTLLNYNDDAAIAGRNAQICNEVLPEDGCYTIVVRSFHNESAGAFELSLRGATLCEAPPNYCEVVTHRGLNLRRAPALDSAVLRTMLQGARVEVFGISDDQAWLSIVHTATGDQGWVANNPTLVECAPGVESTLPKLTVTPLPDTPTPDTPTPGTPTPETPTPNTPTPETPTPVTPPTPTPLPPAKQSPYDEDL